MVIVQNGYITIQNSHIKYMLLDTGTEIYFKFKKDFVKCYQLSDHILKIYKHRKCEIWG